MRFLWLIVFSVAVSVASRLPAESSRHLRNPDELVLEGIQSFEHESIRNVLQSNFDLIVASRPNTPLADYLTTLKNVVSIGFQHSGFASAKVETAYDKARGKIIVRVDECSRRICRNVKVTGAGDELAQAITSALTTHEEPDNILWREGHPVPYDKRTGEEIQRRITAVIAQAGYVRASFKIAISDGADRDSALLDIAISDLGPHAEIGEIVVTGTKRDDAAAVLRHLDLHSGQQLDDRLAASISERLLSTGRYLTSEVSQKRNDQLSGNSREVYDLTIDLREFEYAPPLDEPLLPEEQALLRVADWVARWQRNEVPEDLVITGMIAAGPDEMGAEPGNQAASLGPTNLRMVIAPRRGTILTAQLTARNSQPIADVVLASLPDRLLLGSPLRQEKLEIPHEGTVRLKVTGEMKGRVPELHDGRSFLFNFGASLKSVSNMEGSSLQIEMIVQPTVLLSMFQHEQIQFELEGDLLQIRRPDFKAMVEAATGKPIEIAWTDPESGSKLSIMAVTGALAAEQRQIDERLAGAESKFDPASPWRSACCFVLDDVAFAFDGLVEAGDDAESWRQKAVACRALRKLVHAWSPPSSGYLSGIWNKKDGTTSHRFKLPRQDAEFEVEDLFAQGVPAHRRNLFGFLIGLMHHVLPKDGWMRPVCRDVLLAYGDGSVSTGFDLKEIAQSPATGPLGESMLARLGTSSAPQEGLNRLTLGGFRNDYQPLLAGDNWLSKLTLSLAEAARTLEEDELRALASLAEDAPTRDLLTKLLLTLKAKSDRPVAKSLAASFDEVWKQSFSGYLRVVLESQYAAESTRLSQLQYPKTARPKTTIAEQPTALSDPLSGLEALEEELKAASGTSPDKEVETPLTEALRQLESQQNR